MVGMAQESAATRSGLATSPALHDAMERVRTSINSVILGQEGLVQRLLIALLTNNHALVEGVPGLAKTLTVSALARSIDATFTRIQFTPDLLPADIVGTLVFNPREADFSVRRGPIFANVVLADEINRAPAKVQSALLEAMQERQVSIGGDTLSLPDPFLVLATQNPIEHEGTYPLPEAQLDRFMLKILVDYPPRDAERAILKRAIEGEEADLTPVITRDEVLALRTAVAAVEVNERLREYILRIIEATRQPARFQLEGLAPLIEFGASPRASVFLARAAQANAFIEHREYVLPDDVKSLAPDVLRHRIVTTYEAEARGVDVETIIEQLLGGVGIP